MKITAMHGLTKQEYEKIKAAAKEEISFRVTLRYHKQSYCYGAIDIRPYHRQNMMPPEQVDELIAFAIRHGLNQSMSHFESENRHYIYGCARALNYLYKTV